MEKLIRRFHRLMRVWHEERAQTRRSRRRATHRPR